MNWLGSLGFSSPLWLSLLPLGAAALVYAYLRKGQGKQIVVGTVLLLRSLKRPVLARRKFRPPPRFYFELLLIALLAAGAAGLYRQGAGTRVAVLIDNSFSMAKIAGSDGNRSDSLAVAIRDAASLMQSLSALSRVAVFQTSPQLVSLTQGLQSPDAALRALAGIQIGYGSDNLESAVAKILSNPEFDRLVILSDRPAAPFSSQDRVEFRSSEAFVPSENVAIGSISLERSSKGLEVRVEISSFLQKEARVRVVLESVRIQDRELKATRVAEHPAVLRGISRETISFPPVPPSERAFRVRVETDPSSLGSFFDSIRRDDVAWLSVEAEGGRIALVSQFSSADLKLDSIPFATFAHIRPEQYEANPEQVHSQEYLAALFHRYTPTILPEVSAAFIAPVDGSAFFEVRGEMGRLEVSRWRETHPLLNYLNMSSFRLEQGRILVSPPWAETIISSTQGTLAFAGEVSGRKYVGLGFDLFPYEGKRAALTSIFTLNLLKYLSESEASVGYQPVGSRSPLPPRVIEVTRHDGSGVETLALPKEEQAGLVSVAPGLLAIRTKGDDVKLGAVNFFDSKESNTLQAAPVVIDSAPRTNEDREDVDLLTTTIAVIAAAALVLDLILRLGLLRRSRREGEAA